MPYSPAAARIFDARTSADPVAYRWGAAALLFSAACILTALGIEYIGGVHPCPLCLEQRWAYYTGTPLLFVALVALSASMSRIAAIAFAVVGLMFLANAGLGIYHAGAEWKFWPGPDTCTGAASLTEHAGNLLERMAKTVVIRCDEAALRVFGISLAGWNAVASTMLSTACGLAARSAMGARASHLR